MSPQPDLTSAFDQVDRAQDPASFVHRLDMTADLFGPAKRRTFELLAPLNGSRLLDVGCGTGEDTRSLARLVGAKGAVLGVDASAVMVSTAKERTSPESLPVTYFVGDAHHLDFPEGSFDGSRACHVFMHLEDPQKALGEMARVTRSGGRVVVYEPDLETWIIHGADRSVTRRILNFRCDSFRSGWVGRALPALFAAAGLVDVAIEPSTIVVTDQAFAEQRFGFGDFAAKAQAAGVVSPDEATQWRRQLQGAANTGRFFAALTLFIVSGRKS